jgi:hypothetical protein
LIVNPYNPVLYRYDTATGRQLLQPGEEEGNFVELAFAADDRTLCTLGADATLGHWQAGSGKQINKTRIASR